VAEGFGGALVAMLAVFVRRGRVLPGWVVLALLAAMGRPVGC
jgi:hypothetical protein